MKYLFSLLLLIVFSFHTFASEKVSDEDKAVNIVWQQNILLHGIMKNYMKLGAGVGNNKEIRALDNEIAQFEENLYALSDLSRGTQIEKSIEEVLIHWYKFRLMAISIPSSFDAPIFMFRGQEIMKKLSGSIFLSNKNSQMSKKLQFLSDLMEISNDIPMYYYAQKWGWGESGTLTNKANDNWIHLLFLEKKTELEDLLNNTSHIQNATPELKKTHQELKEQFQLLKKGIESKTTVEVLIALETFEQNFIELCRTPFDKLVNE